MTVRLPFLTAVILGFATHFAEAPALAQNGASPPANGSSRRTLSMPPLREVHVPRNRLADWLRSGQWAPLGIDDYLALRKAATPAAEAPPACYFERAAYEATLVDGGLRHGTIRLEAVRTSNEAALVSLEPHSFVLADLRWADGAAVWGADIAGKTQLLVDRPRGSLLGRWSHAGRKLARGFVFDINLPSAAASTLLLRIPNGFRVSSVAGDIRGPQPAPQPGWSLWHLDLGARSQTRLQISAEEDSPADQAPLSLVHSDVTWDIREEGLRYVGLFDIDVVSGQVSELEFDLPADLTVHRVTSGGDATLAWSSEMTDGRQRLKIRLPEPQRGKLRSLLLEATAPVRLNQQWSLPRAEAMHALYLEGRAAVRLESPLEFQGIAARDFVQTGVSPNDGETESIVFRQDTANAELSLQLGYPSLALSGRVLSELTLADDHWTNRSEIEWRAISASTFQVAADFPRDWDVLEVRTAGESGKEIPLRWDVVRKIEGRRQLVIDFAEPLTSAAPRVVSVVLRQLGPSSEGLLELPVLRPVAAATRHAVVVATQTSGLPDSSIPWAAAGEGLREFEPLPLLAELRKRTTAPARVLFWTDAPGAEGIRLREDSRLVRAQTWITADIAEDPIQQSIVCRVDPAGRLLDSVHVYLTGSLNGRTDDDSQESPIDWKIEEAERFSATRLESSRHADWGLPATGELWEIRFASSQAAPFRLVAVGSAPRTAAFLPVLAFVPEASKISGGIEVVNTSRRRFEIAPRGAVPLTVPAANLERERVGLPTATVSRSWHYENLTDQLQISAAESDREAPATVRCLLRSRCNDGAGSDLHHARFRQSGGGPASLLYFQLAAPARLLSVRVDGELLSSRRDDGTGSILVPMAEDRPWKELSIEYSTPAGEPGLWLERSIVVPQLSLECVDFRWEFWLPEDVRPQSVSSELALIIRPEPLSWRQRLFGPLGRSPHERVFDPLHPLRTDASASELSEAEDSDATGRRGVAALFENASGVSLFPKDGSLYAAVAPTLPETVRVTAGRMPLARTLGMATLLITVLVGLGLRRAELSRRGNIAAVALVTAMVGAFLLPEAAAVIAGGCFCGALVAIVIPRTLVVASAPRPSPSGEVPQGSTATYHHAPAGVAILLAFGLTLAGTRATAQPDATRPVASSSDNAARRDVLIPYEGKNPTSDDVRKSRPEVVYVPRDILERWKAWQSAPVSTPSVLTALTACDVSVSSDDQARASIQFRVSVLGRGEAVRWPLRFSDFAPLGANACLVNDVPFPLQYDGDSGYSLLLPRPEAPGPHPGTSPGQPATTAAVNPLDTVTEYRVSLTGFLRVRVDSTTSERSVALSLLPLPGVVSEWTFPVAQTPLEGLPLRMETVRDSTRQVRWEGRVSNLAARWTTHAAKAPPRAEVELRLSRFVEVAPSVIEIHNRIVGRVLRGSLDDVSWPLPEGSIVQSVAGDQVLSWSVSSSASGPKRLFVEFTQPQTADFRLDVGFLSPVAPNAPASVAAWDVEPINDGRQVARLVLRQVALAPRPGYRVNTSLVESETARSIPVDTFVRNASDWEAARRAVVAWQLQESAPVPVTLTRLEPKKTVRGTQNVVVTPREVLYQWRGEIVTSESVEFRHTLLVDHRIQIESIGVLEDQANRLSRWTRVGDRLVITLSAGTSGTQDVTLVGRLPLASLGEVPLPLVRLDSAAVSDLRLILAASPDLNVELIEPAPLIPFVTTAETAPAVSTEASSTSRPEAHVLGHYQVSGDGDVRLRVQRSTDRPTLEIVSYALPSKRELRWNAALRFDELHGQPRYARFLVGGITSKNLTVKTLPVLEPKLTDSVDGVQVDFPSMSSELETLNIEIEANLPIAAASDPLLPAIETASRLSGHWYLAGRAELIYPARDSAAPADANEIPGWYKSPRTDVAGMLAFRFKSPEARLQWRLTAEQNGVRVLAARTELTWAPAGAPFARTVWRVAPDAGTVATFDWPEGVTLRNAMADGKPLTFNKDDDGRRVRLMLPAGSEPHVLTLDWLPPATSLPWIGSLRLELPELRSLSPADHLVVIHTPPEELLRTSSESARLPRAERLSREIGSWLRNPSDRTPQLSLSSSEMRTTIELVRDLQAELDRNARTFSRDEARSLRSTVAAARATIERSASEEGVSSAIQSTLLQIPVVPGRDTTLGRELTIALDTTTSSLIQLSGFDRRLITVPLVLAASAILAVLAARLLRSGAVPWVRKHRNVACLLIGVVWWFTLQFSVLGFLFLLAALAHILRELLHRPRPREIHV
jgi:hypothetical protein